MKFQFEGYIYSDDKDYIEIDFDFMEKSEFIRILEPDLTIPIMILEKFSNYQIDEFKGILEKITNKEKITGEDKYLCNSKVLKPLFEFFRIDREVIDINSVEISYVWKSPEINVIKTNFTLGNFVCVFNSKFLVRDESGVCNCFFFQQWKEDNDFEELYININELMNLKDGLEKKIFYSVCIPLDSYGHEDDDQIYILTDEGKLYLDICNIDYYKINVKMEIMDPINFLDSFYTQLKNLVFK